MPIVLPDKVRVLLGLLHENGFDAHIVGGCVRDSLMGIIPHDYDICTSATPEQMRRCFEGLRIIETGVLHGTLTVFVENEPFEVTTYRIDGGYPDRRHPADVRFISNIQDDLQRRDFTINAMAYNEADGLVDLFGGAEDLRRGLIRCVGDPDKRFSEDALRLLRALRFASVLGFTVSPATAGSIHKNKDLLKDIACERIGAELGGLLCGQGVEGILLDFADILAVFIPEIIPMVGFLQHHSHHCHDVWTHTALSVASAPENEIIRLALLLHDIAKPACFTTDENGVGHFYGHSFSGAVLAETVLSRLRYKKRTIETVKTLVAHHNIELIISESYVRRLLARLGAETLNMLLDVKLADYRAQNPEFLSDRLLFIDRFRSVMNKVLDEAQCFSLKNLKVNGKDLIKAGIPEGIMIGNILRFLLDQVISGKLENEKEALLEAASKCVTF